MLCGNSLGGRPYVIEARLPYNGRLGFKCSSKIGFRVDASQVYNKSPELQERLLCSYMDLKLASSVELPGLQLEKTLLPVICAVKDAHPEIRVISGKEILIRVNKVTRWEVPEEAVDTVFSILTTEVQRLASALRDIER